MIIETRQQHADAVDRLRKRDPEDLALATFIASLAVPDGPIGERANFAVSALDRGKIVLGGF